MFPQSKIIKEKLYSLKKIFSDFKKSSFTGSGALSFGIKIISLGLSFLMSIAFARFLGVENFGLYSLCIAIVSVLSIPTQLGLPTVLVRFISAYKSQEEWRKLKGLIVWANRTVIILSVLFISLASLYIIYSGNYSDRKYVYLLSLVLLPILSLSAIRAASLRGLERFFWGIAPDTAVKNFLLVALASFYGFFIANSKVSAVEGIVIHLIAVSTSYLLGAWALWKYLPKEVKKAERVFENKKWAKTVLPLSLLSGLTVLNDKTDILMIGYFLEDSEVGIYKIALTISALVVFGLQSINLVMGPYFSKLVANKKKKELQNLVVLSSLAIVIFTVPIIIILFLASNYLVNFVYGTSYIGSVTPLKILLIGHFFDATMGSVALLLKMAGYEKETMITIGGTLCINIGLNILFIPIWGIKGAAIATVLSKVFWNTVLGILVYQKIEILPSVLGLRKWMTSSR